MVRGTGKFKQKRGGGRNFSKNLGERGAFGDKDAHRSKDEEEDSEEDSDKESEEEESEEEEEEGSEEEAGALTRVQKRELKKKQAADKAAAAAEDDEDADLINPNHVQKKMTIADLNAPRELTRREREQKEKADAKERYWKLHLQGKTTEAQSDLARLAKIRAERDAASAKRKAEEEARKSEAESKRRAQMEKVRK